MLVYLSVLFKTPQKRMTFLKVDFETSDPTASPQLRGGTVDGSEIRRENHLVNGAKTLKNHGTNYQTQLVIAGFLKKSTVCKKKIRHFLSRKNGKPLRPTKKNFGTHLVVASAWPCPGMVWGTLHRQHWQIRARRWQDLPKNNDFFVPTFRSCGQ